MALADLINKSRSSSTSLEAGDPLGRESGADESTVAAPAPASSEGGSTNGEETTSVATAEAADTSSPPVSAPDPEGEPTSPEAALETEVSPSGAEDKPYGVAETVTPSGISIYFQSGPKRLYRIGETELAIKKDVVSVSEALDILEKGGLPWWGMKIGIAGVLELARSDENIYRSLINGDVDHFVELLKKHKLTVNHVRDEAGDRGHNVHTGLELWASKQIPPQPAVYAPEEQPYVMALAQFLVDSGAEPVRSEVMVGSVKHKFAGRYDLEAILPNNAEVVVKAFPVKAPIRARIKGGLYLLDAKTSKEVYDTHFIQLEGYEGARLECGYDPTDYRGVIHVMPDGQYELRLNLQHYAWNYPEKDKRYLPRFEDGKPLVTFTDFKHVLALKKALDRIKARK